MPTRAAEAGSGTAADAMSCDEALMLPEVLKLIWMTSVCEYSPPAVNPWADAVLEVEAEATLALKVVLASKSLLAMSKIEFAELM